MKYSNFRRDVKRHVLTFLTSGQRQVTTFCTCAMTSRKKSHVSGCCRQAGDVCCLRCLFSISQVHAPRSRPIKLCAGSSKNPVLSRTPGDPSDLKFFGVLGLTALDPDLVVESEDISLGIAPASEKCISNAYSSHFTDVHPIKFLCPFTLRPIVIDFYWVWFQLRTAHSRSNNTLVPGLLSNS